MPAPAAAPSTHRSILAEWIGTTIAVTGITLSLVFGGWLWRIDMTLYDASVSLDGGPAPAEIVIVAIDQPSLDQIGRWPWRRAVHATLIERLTQSGVRGVAFDVILSEADRSDPRGDAVLAEAMRRNGRVVLPVFLESSRAGRMQEVVPAPVFAAAAAALGHVHLELDADGIARSVYLLEGRGEARYPHLGAALARLGEEGRGSGFPGLRAPPGTAERADTWVRDYWTHIRFLGPPGHFSSVAYADVLTGKVAAGQLAGKFVIVGATAAGMLDAFPTPLSGEARAMPGVEISANVLAGLRAVARGERGFIAIAPIEMQAAYGALLVIALLGACMRLSARRALFVTAFAVLGVIALAFAAMHVAGWWLPPASVVAGLLVCYPVWSWRRLEAAQRYMDEELAQAAREPELLPAAAPQTRTRLAWWSDELTHRIARVERASARLRDLRRLLTDTLNGLPEAAVVVNAEMRISLANAQAAQLLGRPAAALAGEPLAELLAAVLAEGMPSRTSMLEHAPQSFEVRHTDGRDLLVSVVPFTGSTGERRGLLVSLVDVSMLKSAERKREEYMRFLSHDLRSPLASITAMLDLRELAPEIVKDDFFVRIRRGVERSLALADDFVQLGRAESLEESRFVPVDLAELLHAAVDEAGSQARGKNITLAITRSPAEAGTRGVAGVLFRVLINLLGNAIKYSPDATRIECSIEALGGDWLCAIADQGHGIPAEDLPRLFDRFERLEAAKRRGESGAGLGLAFVRTAIEKHGGSIEVTSEPGKGSRFAFRLRAAP